MEVEESGLGEERVADKPLGARQMKEYYERGSGVNSSAAGVSHHEDPPWHKSARSPRISPVVFCAACSCYLSNEFLNHNQN